MATELEVEVENKDTRDITEKNDIDHRFSYENLVINYYLTIMIIISTEYNVSHKVGKIRHR